MFMSTIALSSLVSYLGSLQNYGTLTLAVIGVGYVLIGANVVLITLATCAQVLITEDFWSSRKASWLFMFVCPVLIAGLLCLATFLLLSSKYLTSVPEELLRLLATSLASVTVGLLMLAILGNNFHKIIDEIKLTRKQIELEETFRNK